MSNKSNRIFTKLVAFILALVMVFSNTITGFASTAGSGGGGSGVAGSGGASYSHVILVPIITVTDLNNVSGVKSISGKKITLDTPYTGYTVKDKSKALYLIPSTYKYLGITDNANLSCYSKVLPAYDAKGNVTRESRYLYQIDTAHIDNEHDDTKADYHKMDTLNPVLKSALNAELGGTSADTAISNYDNLVKKLKDVKKSQGSDKAYDASLLKFFTEADTIYTGLGGAFMNQYLAPLGFGYAFQCMKNGFNQVSTFNQDYTDISGYYQAEVEALTKNLDLDITEDNPLIVNVSWFVYIWYPNSTNGIDYIALNPTDYLPFTHKLMNENGKVNGAVPFSDTNSSLNQAFLGDTGDLNINIPSLGVGDARDITGMNLATFTEKKSASVGFYNISSETNNGGTYRYVSLTLTGDEYTYKDSNNKTHKAKKINPETDWYLDNDATTTWRTDFSASAIWSTDLDNPGAQAAAVSTVKIDGYNTTDVSSSNAELVKKTEDDKGNTAYKVYSSKDENDVFKTNFNANTLVNDLSDDYSYKQAVAIGRTVAQGTSLDTVLTELKGYKYEVDYAVRDVEGGTTVVDEHNNTQSLNIGRTVAFKGITPTTGTKNSESDENDMDDTTKKSVIYGRTVLNSALIYGYRGSLPAYTNLNTLFTNKGEKPTKAEQVKNALDATYTMVANIGTGKLDSANITEGVKHTAKDLTEVNNDYAVALGDINKRRSGRFVDTTLVYYKPTKVISTMYHANVSTRFDASTGKYYAKVTCTGGVNDTNSTVKYSMENLGQFRLPANTVGVVAIPINKITGTETIKDTQDMSWDDTKKAINNYINNNVVKSKEFEVETGKTDLVNTVVESCTGYSKKIVNGISGGEVFNVGANCTTDKKTNSGVCGYVLVAITAPDDITVKSKTVSDDDNLQDGNTSGKIVVRSYALNKVTADVSEIVTGFKQTLYSQTHKYVVTNSDKADIKVQVDLNKGNSGVTLGNDSYKFNAILKLTKGKTTKVLDNCVTGTAINTINYNVRVTHRLNYAQAVTGTHNAGDYYYNTGFKGDDNTGWFGGNFAVSSVFNNNATAKFNTVDKEAITGNVRNRYTRNTSQSVADRQLAATNNEKVSYFTYAVETKRKDFGDVLTVSNFSGVTETDMNKAVNDLATVGTDTRYSDKPSENNVSIKGNDYFNKVSRLSTVLSTKITWTSKSGAKLKSDKATELRNLITDGDSCLKRNGNSNEWYYYGTHRVPVTSKTADKVSVTGADGAYNMTVTYALTNLGKNLKSATITQYNTLGFHPVHYSVEGGTLRGTTDNLYKYTPLEGNGIDLYLYGKVASGDGIGTTGKRLSVTASQRFKDTQEVKKISDIVFGKNKDYYTPSQLIAAKGRFSTYSGIDAKELTNAKGSLKKHAYNLDTANNNGKTRGIKFSCTGLSYRQVNLEIEEYCQAYKVPAKTQVASNTGDDEIIYKSDSVMMFRDKVVGDTKYSTGETKDSAIKLQYYPEVNMLYYNIKKEAQDDKMFTSADDSSIRTIKVMGEQQRQSYSSGLYIYSYSEGLKASNTAERDKDLTINNTDNSNTVSGVTVSSGYQVTTDSKTSKKPTVYAGSDVTLNVEPNFTLNLYGYVLDVTDKSIDGKDDEPEKKVGNNVIPAKNYGYITSGNTLIQDGQLPQAKETTLKSNAHELYKTVVAGVQPDVYTDWGNYSKTETKNGKDTTTHNADLLKKDFGDWATTMLNPKNYEVSIKLQVKDGNTLSKEYNKFNTSFGKIALVKNGKVGTQSFSATNNVHEDGVYHINIENGDIVRTEKHDDGKLYYDKYYLALIEQIADDADLSLADADKYFMESDLHSSILNAIQSSKSDENHSGMTEYTAKKDDKTVDASGLGNDKNWYDEKVKTIVIRRFKTDSVSISGTVLQDKIDYNVTGANNNKTYTGQWYFSLTLKNLDKTGIGTALKNNSEKEYTLVKDMQIKDADFDIRNSSVDAGN